jgi:Mn-dependent DtxR family transcriptional regulator
MLSERQAKLLALILKDPVRFHDPGEYLSSRERRLMVRLQNAGLVQEGKNGGYTLTPSGALAAILVS